MNAMKPKLFGALHSTIKMGCRVEAFPPSDLHQFKEEVLEATARTIDERLAVGYARLLWLTLEVRNNVNNNYAKLIYINE